MKKRSSWIFAFIAAFALWCLFGAVPFVIELVHVVNSDDVQRVAPFSGIFGAAEAFFSGFALIAVIISIQQQRESLLMQSEELKLSRQEMQASTEAQQDMAEQQKKAICLEIIMPFMSEISSSEMRKALIVISKFGREFDFQEKYAALITKRDNDLLSDQESEQFELIDNSRRQFVGIFHKMFRLYKTGVVDDDIVRVVIGPDHCHMLLKTVEPLEAKIRTNYSRDIFDFARKLYSDATLEEQGSHKRASLNKQI
ncbi:hypothetical protein [Pseudaeromonas paramecii]|uniref:Uncharacterized protein n=1 Tax=Pseudaeromonas paramecii TaxID=2138166 RepID=A0ABP8PYQ4_9GAMM